MSTSVNAARAGVSGPRAAPAFRAAADDLAHAITAGRVTGDLPSEKVLGERYGVSRVTIRRALGVLADKGLVAVTWGRGWSVAHGPLSEPANSLLSVTELAGARHLTVTSRVLLAQLEPTSLDDAELLDIAPGASTFVLKRVRYNDDAPLTLQLSRIVADRVAGIEDVDFTERSLYEVLEQKFGISPTRADYAVEARPTAAEHAELLGVAVGSPLLWATQKTYDQHGVAVEAGWSAYPYDRYRFRATLTRSPGGANSDPARQESVRIGMPRP